MFSQQQHPVTSQGQQQAMAHHQQHHPHHPQQQQQPPQPQQQQQPQQHIVYQQQPTQSQQQPASGRAGSAGPHTVQYAPHPYQQQQQQQPPPSQQQTPQMIQMSTAPPGATAAYQQGPPPPHLMQHRASQPQIMAYPGQPAPPSNARVQYIQPQPGQPAYYIQHQGPPPQQVIYHQPPPPQQHQQIPQGQQAQQQQQQQQQQQPARIQQAAPQQQQHHHQQQQQQQQQLPPMQQQQVHLAYQQQQPPLQQQQPVQVAVPGQMQPLAQQSQPIPAVPHQSQQPGVPGISPVPANAAQQVAKPIVLPPSKIPELLDAIRVDFEAAAQEAAIWRSQKQELEESLNIQINEMNSFKAVLQDLERAHKAIHSQYQDEIHKLRMELDRVVGAGTSTIDNGNRLNSSQEPLSQPPHPKRSRGDDGNPLPPPSTANPDASLEDPRRKVAQQPQPIALGRSPQLPHAPPPPIQTGPVLQQPQPQQQQQQQQQQQHQQHPTTQQQPPHNTMATRPPPPATGPVGQPQVTGLVDLVAMGMDPTGAPSPWKWDSGEYYCVSNARSKLARPRMVVGPEAAKVANAPPVMATVHLEDSFDHEGVVCCVRFSLQGNLLATGSNRIVQIFAVPSNGPRPPRPLFVLRATPQDTISGPEQQPEPSTSEDLYIRSVCFSPDARFLAAGSEDHVVRVWELPHIPSEGGTPMDESKGPVLRSVLKGHVQDVYALDWSVDGRYIVSGSGDRTVRVWDWESGGLVRLLIDESAASMPETGGVVADAGVTSLALSPGDPRCLVTGSLDRMIRVWDIRTGRLLERFEGHQDSVYSVSFFRSGRSIASGSLDHSVKVWDLHPNTIAALSSQAPSPTSTQPPTQSQDTIKTRSCRQTYLGHRDFVLSVGCAQAGFTSAVVGAHKGDPALTGLLETVEWVASASKDKSVVLWDARGAAGTQAENTEESVVVAPQCYVEGHRNSVISLALSPKDALFATGSGDRKARIWRLYVTPAPISR